MEHALPRAPSTTPSRYATRKYSEWEVYWRFFKYLRPYKNKVILCILLVFVGTPIGTLGLFLNRYLIDNVILNVEAPTATRLTQFWIIIAAQISMWFIGRTSTIIRQIIGWYLDLKVSITLRKVFYDHLQRLSLQFHRSRPIGVNMYRSTADVGGGTIGMITDFGPDVVEQVYSILWAAILLSVVDWRITLLILAYVIPYTLGAHYFYTKRQEALRAVKLEAEAQVAALRDGIAGAKTVKSFGRIHYQTRKYVAQIIRTQRAQLREFFIGDVLTNQGLLWLIPWVMHKGMWFYLVYRTMAGFLTLGEFTVVYALARDCEGRMEGMVRLLQNVRLQLVSAERVLETLDVPQEIEDAPDARPMPPVKGRVDFQDLHFSYVEGMPVLRGISFSMEPGQSVALVGPTGAGKTTLLSLLMRLHDPQQGRILVDGIDIRSVKMDTLREQIGVVLQETFLFGGTVADSIRFGKLKATDAEVKNAAALADIDRFVETLPAGYDTYLGEGTKLSGGQRQRLGIARALVRDPGIVIMDEATAHLDARSEGRIVHTLERALRGRTTLTVSHRLVTITNADRIYVIDRGGIVDSGTHDELLARGGLYAQMWVEQTQLKGVSREAMRLELGEL
jgi:ATP-binding cassette, subfamily B, bacterial MsbA